MFKSNKEKDLYLDSSLEFYKIKIKEFFIFLNSQKKKLFWKEFENELLKVFNK